MKTSLRNTYDALHDLDNISRGLDSLLVQSAAWYLDSESVIATSESCRSVRSGTRSASHGADISAGIHWLDEDVGVFLVHFFCSRAPRSS